MSKKKIRVGIFFGGTSPEHDVSLVSANGIISNINKTEFSIKKIFIDKNGQFWIKNKPLNLNSLSQIIDVAFPVLHGEGGEDGSIQGFFETQKIPFVGCGVASSAICLDKAHFNQIMFANGIKQAKFEILDFQYETCREINKKIESIKKKFKTPLFIKPARTGSSIGIFKINDVKMLKTKLNQSKKFDNKIVIEEGVRDAVEIEVSVFGNDIKDIKASLPGRVIPGAEFYDYDDKYINNKTTYEIPAKLSKTKIREITNLATKIYKLANCSGLARVDFLLDKQRNIYLNEINTIPGFTPFSMYPKLWESTGLSYKNLISKLIMLALNKKR
ncbi:MAG: D-alanine--D-alanine ligase family protein [Candidatus Uhrbacteria bacterium]